jgi:zinc/manganese transport system ATP-binding protein
MKHAPARATHAATAHAATAHATTGHTVAGHTAAGHAHGPGPDLLRLEDVGVRLGGRQILSGVSLSIAPGEFTGLIGPNGAGKTTLLRIILGLQPVTSGQVLLDGAPRSHHDSSIGYVPQKLSIEPDMPLRVRDVVSLGIDGNKFGIQLPSRARRERVEEMLAAVGAQRYANARVGELSGGEQQRVMIAHALISRPRLLLLDEPLANLDISSEQGIVSVLARLARAEHVAVLLSAHDMNPLMPVMDRIIYVAAGRVAVGRTDEVVQPAVLSRLYGQHVDVIRVHGRVLVVAAPEGTDSDEDTHATAAAHVIDDEDSSAVR